MVEGFDEVEVDAPNILAWELEREWSPEVVLEPCAKEGSRRMLMVLFVRFSFLPPGAAASPSMELSSSSPVDLNQPKPR